MRCKACAQSIRPDGEPVPEYRAGCRGCQARAVARSDAMRVLTDDTASSEDKLQAKVDVRKMIETTMRGVDYHDARLAVGSWVRALNYKGKVSEH